MNKQRRGWIARIRSLRNIPPLLNLVCRSSPGAAIAVAILRATTGVVPLGILAVMKQLIDAVVAHRSGHIQLLPRIWWLLALELMLAAMAALLGRVIDFCDALIADRFTLRISTKVMQHTSSLDLSRYEDPDFYDKLERARVQTTDRIGMIEAIGRLLQEAISTISLAFGIFIYSPAYVVILLLAIVPVFLGDGYFAFRGYLLAFQQVALRRELDYIRLLGASKETAKELKLFGLSSYWVSLYKQLSARLHRQNIKLTTQRLAAGVTFSLLATVGYYSAYALAIYKTVQGQLTLGTLAFLAGAIAGASRTLQSTFSTVAAITDQSLFLNDLFEIFAVKPTIRSSSHAIKTPIPIRRGFEFRNVSFSYPGSPDLVLRDLSFSVNPEECLALVGSNGSGKTTIVKLITRLYDPSDGQILLDGVDLREYDLDDLHRQFAVIFQDFVRYDRTALQNISLGDVDKTHSRRMIEKVARKSSAHEFIASLPRGYQQMLGRRFEGGVDLSGGEWQRIALARAYLRKSQILILDEPTAALDSAAEIDLINRFAEFTAGRMVLLISHRFSTIRRADRILVLENGQIVEEGKHTELVGLTTRYSEMFESQASQYR